MRPTGADVSAIFSPKGLFIGGEWIPTAANEAGINPADECTIASAPAGALPEVDAAIDAARRCFDSGRWSGLAPKERQRLLQRFVDATRARADQIKALLVA